MHPTPESNAYFAIRLKKTREELRKRQFGAEYFESVEEMREWLLPKLERNVPIAFGGSRTLADTKVLETLRDGSYMLIDRDKPGIGPEERNALQVQGFSAGVFLASVNALCETGQFVNIDGSANRATAIAYGPSKVYLIVGRNKLAKDLNEGLARAKGPAAVTNAMRLKRKTPCVATGSCEDCRSPERICSITVIHEWSAIPGRITLLLVNEELGF